MDRGEPKLGDLIHIIDDPRVRREYIEMVVFVLVLVCFLRQFGAEAYVIPSGSMAPTLMGANKVGICPECGHVNFVNVRDEAEDGGIRCRRTLSELSASARIQSGGIQFG